MQKAVNAEAKAGLRSSIIIWDLDIHYPRGYWPSNSITLKVQSQGTTTKESNPEESKLKELKSIENFLYK